MRSGTTLIKQCNHTMPSAMPGGGLVTGRASTPSTGGKIVCGLFLKSPIFLSPRSEKGGANDHLLD